MIHAHAKKTDNSVLHGSANFIVLNLNQILKFKQLKKGTFSCIMIPAHSIKKCQDAFYGCDKLNRVDFMPISDLRTIEKEANSR